jgi:hypothetical protein
MTEVFYSKKKVTPITLKDINQKKKKEFKTHWNPFLSFW